MELSQFFQQAMFDEPVVYKNIKIYPITIKNYTIAHAASCAFAINTADEKDLELLGLPYMEYIYKKAQKYPEFMSVANIFNSVLSLSFREQIHSFKYENGFLKLVVAVPTDKYNEEAMCVYREKLSTYQELSKDEFHALLNEAKLKKLKEEIKTLANEMFIYNEFNDNEFEEIKTIICYLNDIDDTIIKDSRWEAELKKAAEIMSKINQSKNPPELEDLVNAVAFSLGKLPEDIKDMTVRRFNRYLDMAQRQEDYKLCKAAELNGSQFKTPIKHWLQAYKPKTRYSGLQTGSEGMSEIFNKE